MSDGGNRPSRDDGEREAKPDAGERDPESDGRADGGGTDDAYGGVLGTFPYAFRTTDSRLLKSYVVVGGLAAAFIVLQFAISVLVVVSNTLGARGGTFTFSRTFIVVVGLFVLAPVIAPVLYVARRRRQGTAISGRYDLAMALGGYIFLLALYLGLVISMPECFEFGNQTTCRPEPSGVFEPLIRWLYGLPPIVGLVPPTLAGLLIVAFDRYLG